MSIQRDTLNRLERAYQNFFQRRDIGFRKFKGRHYWHGIAIAENVKVRGTQLHIRSFGDLTIRRKGGNPYRNGMPVSAVLKRIGSKWFATVCYTVEIEPLDTDHVIGLDRNVGQVADSEGIVHTMSTALKLDGKIKRLQRQAVRPKKNW
ncbi:MAG: hypothetical protein OXE94_14110 [Aestuariivita sp.]|nr:hypothetical protein [Aestuariivita sp.]MCY4202304.1 hypothetical protein [Aestuariivita sp.]